MKKFFSLLLCIIAIATANAQNTVKGTIRMRNAPDSIAGITVVVKGTTTGTTTDAAGGFQVPVAQLPTTLSISCVGFRPVEVTVRAHDAGTIFIDPLYITGGEVVIAPDRIAGKGIKSAVSYVQYNYRDIKNAPATSYYDLAKFKTGIDITTSSITFNTISTRGFNGSGSTRVNQFMDGMNGVTPGLNFPIGCFAGLTDLDIDRVEILAGASSALYGPGGINGTVLINSKNPYQYQGLSIQVKEGINNVDKSQRSSVGNFHDFSFRYAKAFNNKFAFKIGGQYIKAIDWLAHDTSNYSRQGDAGKLIPGTRASDPNYEGVNVYGDETQVNIGTAANPLYVSRIGYNEIDMIDPEAKNIRLSGALHYKFNRKLEAILMGYWATGNTVYTGNNRYSLKDIKLGQYKAELKGSNWFLRSYTTQEDAGEAYSATAAAQVLNEIWKPSATWYKDYGTAYMMALAMGSDNATAHQKARAAADKERPLPGSEQFKQLLDKARSMPIPNGGLFLETSQLWASECQYRFTQVKFVNILVGADFKKYILNSEGTLFIDRPGHPINFMEYGTYGQVSKELLKNKLALSFSGRYDKNEDFKGHFTPRATALIKVAGNNNIRLSYQTAYRFPSTQQKYIKLNVGSYTILGGLPWILDTMNVKTYPVIDAATGKPFVYEELKPEACRSFEVGYKTVVNQKLLIDAYAYFGKYTDFLGRQTLYQPVNNKIYSVVVNSGTEVNTHGFGLSFDYYITKNFSTFLNGYSDVITDVPTGFRSYFNTPKYRTNFGFAGHDLGKNKAIGFNVMGRWQDAFEWDGELANGPLKAFTTVDASVSYKFQPIRTMVKLGGTNIFNHYYKNAYGNPEIGGLYYLSFNFEL